MGVILSTIFQNTLKQKAATALRYRKSHRAERNNLKRSISFYKN